MAAVCMCVCVWGGGGVPGPVAPPLCVRAVERASVLAKIDWTGRG